MKPTVATEATVFDKQQWNFYMHFPTLGPIETYFDCLGHAFDLYFDYLATEDMTKLMIGIISLLPML